jgi:hypothetical protein
LTRGFHFLSFGTSLPLNNSMSLVKSSLENQPFYNLESIFRAFKRKEMKASRRLAEHDIISDIFLITKFVKKY